MSKQRIFLALGLVAVCVGGLTAVLMMPADPIPADRTEHVRRAEGLPPILPETSYRQVFTAKESGLSKVRARFGTYRGATRCTVRVQFGEVGEDAMVDRLLPCKDIPDNETMTIVSVPPIRDSEGVDYELRLSVLPGLEESVLPLGGVPKPGVQPAEIGGVRSELAIGITTQYGRGSSAGEQLDSALRRMGQYRIWWGRGPFPVLLALAALAAAVAAILFPRRAFLLLLLLFFIKGILWSVIMPLLEAPDEGAHFAYVQFIAEQKKIPRRGHSLDGLPAYSQELTRATSLLNVEAQDPGDRPDFGPGDVGPDEDRFTGSRLAGGNNAAAGYPPAYYLPATIPYLAARSSSFVDRIGLMRLWSVLLGVASAAVAFRIGVHLFSSKAAALALATGSAFHPMVSQQTSAINNDALIIFAGWVTVLMALRLAHPDADRATTLVAGLAVGLAALAKPIGLLLAPTIGIAFLVGRFRAGERSLPKWIGRGWPFVVGLASTYGMWFFVSKVFNYPSLSFSEPPIPGAPRGIANYLYLMKRDGFASLRTTWVRRFWADLSWLDTGLSNWVYTALTSISLIVAAAAIAGVVVTLKRIRRMKEQADAQSWTDPMIMILFIVTVLGVLHVIEFMQFAQTGRAGLLQGRYALMIVPAVVALPAVLAKAFVPKASIVVLAWGTALPIVALNVMSLGTLIDRFYL